MRPSTRGRRSTSSKSVQVEVLAALAGGELEPVSRPCIDLDDEGVVRGLGKGCSPSRRLLPGVVVLPALCNAHLHILDASIAEAGETLPLNELVELPTGLKYRLLSSLGDEEIAERASTVAARAASEGALYAGVYAELGARGVELVRKIMSAPGSSARILAQPESKSLEAYSRLLREVGGVGLDTALDLAPWELKQLAGEARRIGGHVHVHVSETPELYRSRDYELVLETRPSAAIHLTYLSPEELTELARAGIGLVFCPRSNMYHLGRLPALSLIPALARETMVALGTDNAAWVPPRVAEEMAFAYIAAHSPGRSSAEALAETLLRAATLDCARLLGLEAAAVEEGAPADRLLAAALPEAQWSGSLRVTLVKRLSGAPVSILQALLAG
ncbi:amidohydrolase family protein [Pyrodictium occultum]|uniref:amidohydrolase family protein n=1 Tax=Pyrodictium occultum TaxID=2309 RepID=UPI0009F89F98|nr:amidohydrolase family protein [Pyrodictium occultum]